MYMSFEEFVHYFEKRLLRSLTKQERDFTRWMYNRYVMEELQELPRSACK